MNGFESFIAIDWSGAKGRYSGIAVAECGGGSTAPNLIEPAGSKFWTRTEVEKWLRFRLGGPARLLVGIDCAFSLPWSRASAYGVEHGPGLWALVDEICRAEEDYSGGSFVSHPGCDGHFWSSGKMPAGCSAAPRQTESACRQAGLGTPESPYKLIGPKQVGKGALAGMRLLQRLRDTGAAVWPFDDRARSRSCIVEIYPRLFLRMAGFGNAKVRTLADLNRCLARLTSLPSDMARPLSDHETDALISAAGLRHLGADPDLWDLSDDRRPALRREGWIFGVPHPAAP